MQEDLCLCYETTEYYSEALTGKVTPFTGYWKRSHTCTLLNKHGSGSCHKEHTLQPAQAPVRNSHPTDFYNQELVQRSACGRAKCGLRQLVRLHKFSVTQSFTQTILKSVQMLGSKTLIHQKKVVNNEKLSVNKRTKKQRHCTTWCHLTGLCFLFDDRSLLC